MNQKKLLLTAQSALCVLLAIMLAASAIGIFREGLLLKAADPLSPIYTREKVLAALVPVLPVMLLSLAVTAAGLLRGVRDEAGCGPVQDTEILRDLTVSRVAAPTADMLAERARQKKLFFGGWALFGLCMVPVLLYLANGDHFPAGDLESMFFSLLLHVLPWTAMGLAALMVSTLLQEQSMRRETEAARAALLKEKAAGAGPAANAEPGAGTKSEAGAKPAESARPGEHWKTAASRGHVQALRALLLALAVGLIAAGALNGSAMDVFGKAVNICTECIGLG